LLLFCVVAYLVLPDEVNGAFHTHRRFSVTAIFLMLALGSAAPMASVTRRTMMVVALIATTVTAGLQAKANREVIARITPSIKACLVPPASRLLVARFGTAIYGHPLRYRTMPPPGHALPGDFCQFPLARPGVLSATHGQLERRPRSARTAPGWPSKGRSLHPIQFPIRLM
jgi:hypothetical protein